MEPLSSDDQIKYCKREIKKNKVLLAAFGLIFILIAFKAPDGSNPACQELWCKILVKSVFLGLGGCMLWSALQMTSLPNRIFCRIFFGKKSYSSWLKYAKLYDAKQYDKIDITN